VGGELSSTHSALEISMAGDSWATAVGMGIAIAAIAIATAFYYTATAWFAHRERMAKIGQGIDPDNPQQKNAAK
jgi:hypothetical protein